MARFKAKHLIQYKINMPNLMGGVCLTSNPEAIPDNCLRSAPNWEYGTTLNQLQVVPGLTTQIDIGAAVDTGFYDSKNDKIYTSVGTALYVTDLATKTSLGTLNGSYKPVYSLWDTVTLVASGGTLQETAGATLVDVSGAPNAHYVTNRYGRVLCVNITTDRLTYSDIGDRTGWVNNPSDISTSQYLDVGYKDSTNIAAVIELSDALIVIKASGNAYAVFNENDFTNIAVKQIATRVYSQNHYSGLSVGSKAYFLGAEGFQSFVTTSAYGDMILDDPPPGYFINTMLVQNIDSNAQLWHLPTRKQIWIKSQNDKQVYIYHYGLKTPVVANNEVIGYVGVSTWRIFQYQITDVFTKGQDVYICYGNKIAKLDDATDKDDGVQIVATLKPKRFLPKERRKFEAKYLHFETYNILAGNVVLYIDTKPFPMTFSATGDIARDDTNIARDDTDIVSTSEYSEINKKMAKHMRAVDIILTVNSGRIAIRGFYLDVAEIG